MATPSASYTSGDTSVTALNDCSEPRNSRQRGTGSYGNWPSQGTQWVQYDWSKPISTKRLEVFWSSKLRLEMDGAEQFSTGLLEWRVFDPRRSPKFPPSVVAGVDRVVMVGGDTYLSGKVRSLENADNLKIVWTRQPGPGRVRFADASHCRLATRSKWTARKLKPGETPGMSCGRTSVMPCAAISSINLRLLGTSGSIWFGTSCWRTH